MSRIDAHHLKLMKPVKIAPGSTVMIAIIPTERVSEEQEWYFLSSQGLEDAYGKDEPDYFLDSIKEFNPDYELRESPANNTSR